MCCNVLQCVAACCSVLQREISEIVDVYEWRPVVAMCRSLLQCVAMCRSVFLCVPVCCSVLQCVAVCCSVMQCEIGDIVDAYDGRPGVAVCCSVLQCVAL